MAKIKSGDVLAVGAVGVRRDHHAAGRKLVTGLVWGEHGAADIKPLF